jgi:hypothetical protein
VQDSLLRRHAGRVRVHHRPRLCGACPDHN